MSVSSIDTLMQLTTPTRPPEPPARNLSEASSFAPRLEQAYADDKLREPFAPTEEKDPAGASVEQAEDSDGHADQSAGETDEALESIAPVEEGDLVEEESADEVEISELASTLVANEPKLAAESEQKALELVSEMVGASESEGLTEKANAGPNGGGDESKQKETLKATLAAEILAVAQDEAAADGNRPVVTADAKWKSTKGSNIVRQTDAADEATETSPKKLAASTTSTELAAVQAAKVADNSVAAELSDGPEAEASGESKADRSDGVERMKLPPVEPTGELAAAIERHIALMEQSVGAAPESSSGSSASTSMTEAANGSSSPTKPHATLDRLAAASLRRNESAGSAEGGSAIDRHRFVQRVEGAMRAAQQRDGRVQVRLAPPELGSLRIELSVQNGVMAAKLEAETPAARNALLDNLPTLRERLAEQNIRVEKFDVDIRRDSQGSGGDGAASERRDGRNGPGAHERRDRGGPLPQPKAALARTTRAATPTSDASLDVRI